MRKALSVLLVLLMASALLLTSCNGGKPVETTPETTKQAEISQELLDNAADMVYTFNKPGENNQVSSSFTLPSKLIDQEGFDLDVNWTVEGGNGLASIADSSEENKVLIKVDPYADKDTEFTVKGNVVGNGLTSKEITFKYVIKQYEIANWAYWAENTKDAAMNVRGVIVAKYPYAPDYKNTGVFIQDLDGEHGYFGYRLKCDSQEEYDTKLAIGNVIVISGTTSIYNGFREMGAGCTYSLVYDGSEIKKAEVKKIPLDDMFKPETNLVSALDQYQGVICTLTGAKITKIEWVKNTFETFEEAGDGRVTVTVSKNGVDFSLFLSTSCTFTVAELKEEYSKLGVGYTVDIEGPMAWNNEPQIYPCVGGITVTSTDISDEEKLANEIAAVSIPENTNADLTVDLPAQGATYDAVKFDWKLDPADSAKIENGKLVITLGSGIEELKLTLTATCGSLSETKEYKVVVMPANLTQEEIVNALYKLEKGKALPGTFTLKGKITKIDTAYSEQYGNITVTIVVGDMADKPVQCFRMKGEGAPDLKVGDVITVTGVLKRYNDTFEFDANCTLDKIENGSGEAETQPAETEPAETEPPKDDSVEKLLKAAYALDKGKALDGTHTLSGTITRVNTPYDAGYQNVTVTIVCDGLDQYPIQCFRMKGEGADKVKVGDKITVEGKIKKYTDGTVEFDAGCTLKSIDFVAEGTNIKYNTPEEIVKALYALDKGDSLPGNPYRLTGKVTSITEAYTEEHKNISFVIVVEGLADYPVTVYRIKGEGVENIKVDDTVTIEGNLIHYYNANRNESVYEFTTGATLIK